MRVGKMSIRRSIEEPSISTEKPYVSAKVIGAMFDPVYEDERILFLHTRALIFAKELINSTKEPCISAKESCISAKWPYTSEQKTWVYTHWCIPIQCTEEERRENVRQKRRCVKNAWHTTWKSKNALGI